MRHTLIIALSILLIGCPATDRSTKSMDEEDFFTLPEPVQAPTLPPVGDRASASVVTPHLPRTDAEAERERDDILAQLYEASIAFDVPSFTWINSPVVGNLIISFDKTVDCLIDEIGTETASGERIQVSRIIVATMRSSGFEITSITPERQALSLTRDTRWKWELKPIAEGSHTVRLSIVAVVIVDDYRTEHHLRTFTHEIEVEVSKRDRYSSWFYNNWQWIVSTLLIPIIIFCWRRRKEKGD